MVEKAKTIKVSSEILAREDYWLHKDQLIRMILRVIVGMGLLVGGLVLLALRIAGWSIIIGLPMIIFGSVFVIYTYDEVLSRKLDPHNQIKDYDDEM